MVFGKLVSEPKDAEVAAQIYTTVYEEELGLAGDLSAADGFCQDALAYDGDIPVGVGSIMYDGDRFTITGVAVRKEHRRKRYGDFLVRLMVDKALMSNAQEIYLDARTGTEDFFAGIGFQVNGEAFERFGESWTPMKLTSNQIHKCCGCSH